MAAPSLLPPPTVATGPMHLPVSGEMLHDAVMLCGVALLLAVIAMSVKAQRRRSVMFFALFAVVTTVLLYALAVSGNALGEGMPYHLAREGLLALLALALIRTTLIFTTRVVLARFAIPLIIDDVLLTLGLIVFALYRLTVIGVNLAGIVTTSAVITGAIAFSAQEILGALWAGLALQAEKSLRQGDWIRHGDKLGQVVHLRWRSTAICTPDHETIIIPNAALVKGQITVVGRRGEERSMLRRHVQFTVAYESPPHEVIGAIREALSRAEIANVAPDPAAFCVLRAFEDSGVAYEVLYHIMDIALYPVTDSAVLTHIFAALRRYGMTVPYPQRVIHTPKDAELRSAQREMEQRTAVLRATGLFAPLTEEERQEVAAELKTCPYAAGSIIFREGEHADSLFVLAAGTLSVFLESVGGTRQELAMIEAINYVGERGLLLGQPRFATVMAQSDALCYRLDRSGFDGVLRKRPEMIEDLSRVIAQRQAKNDETLQGLDEKARNERTRSHAARLVDSIRTIFGMGHPSAARVAERKVAAANDSSRPPARTRTE